MTKNKPGTCETGCETDRGGVMGKITDAQAAACKWLYERGGSGVLDNRARVVAWGEVCGNGHDTWLRLLVSEAAYTTSGRIFLSPECERIARAALAQQEEARK